ncbi:MAG: SDR family oxidoreductase [Pseudomonadota bacterium]
MPDLRDQRVVITGAAQGLGAALAQVFAEQGARLVLMDVDGAALAATRDAIGVPATCLSVDLADAAATATAIASLPGPVDTLIHNAAILRPEPIADVTLDTFRATLDVGIQAAFQLTQAVWPGMIRTGGALIFVSSQSGIKGFADETAYCAAKHALEGFSKCLALEAADRDIVSCTITPGMPMRTPMSEQNYTPDMKAKWVDPALLAPAFVHIATRRDKALNGQRLSAWDLSQEHPF